jgi:hypothetical protein
MDSPAADPDCHTFERSIEENVAQEIAAGALASKGLMIRAITSLPIIIHV